MGSLSPDCAARRRAANWLFTENVFPWLNQQAFAVFLRTLFQQDWVVYAKPPFGGPEHVLQYLARYTHRVAISNHRLLAVTDSHVTFRWKDYAHHSRQRTMTLTGEEFLRRFVQHVLPKGFPRIRYFGWLANRRRKNSLPLCRLSPRPNAARNSWDADRRTRGLAVPLLPGTDAGGRTADRLTDSRRRNQEGLHS